MHISKTFTFDAAHHLNGLAEGHPCSRVHGHTYRVELIVEGPLDDKGFVCDYAEIAKLWQPLHELLDHRNLNEVEGFAQPSTENLAIWIYHRILESPNRDMNLRKLKHLGLAPVTQFAKVVRRPRMLPALAIPNIKKDQVAGGNVAGPGVALVVHFEDAHIIARGP